MAPFSLHMQRINSFPAIVDHQTHTLILGTMPGVTSLQKYEYYGYAQNQFWKIMFTVFHELPVSTIYDEKVALLQKNNIGLWDVLHGCERVGSLDSKIKNHIENDIPRLLNNYPTISKILFNGKESHRYFIRAFGVIEGIEYHVMPSTSPAYTIKFDEKLKLWSQALQR